MNEDIWADIDVVLDELEEKTVPSGLCPLSEPSGIVLWEMTTAPTRPVSQAVIDRLLQEAPQA